MFSRYLFLLFFCFSFAEQPNVILILSDDMGYSDLPKFGETGIPTPDIDRLAREGVLFTDAYVTAPICVASLPGIHD